MLKTNLSIYAKSEIAKKNIVNRYSEIINQNIIPICDKAIEFSKLRSKDFQLKLTNSDKNKLNYYLKIYTNIVNDSRNIYEYYRNLDTFCKILDDHNYDDDFGKLDCVIKLYYPSFSRDNTEDSEITNLYLDTLVRASIITKKDKANLIHKILKRENDDMPDYIFVSSIMPYMYTRLLINHYIGGDVKKVLDFVLSVQFLAKFESGIISSSLASSLGYYIEPDFLSLTSFKKNVENELKFRNNKIVETKKALISLEELYKMNYTFRISDNFVFSKKGNIIYLPYIKKEELAIMYLADDNDEYPYIYSTLRSFKLLLPNMASIKIYSELVGWNDYQINKFYRFNMPIIDNIMEDYSKLCINVLSVRSGIIRVYHNTIRNNPLILLTQTITMVASIGSFILLIVNVSTKLKS
jgi:hypothetical protein